MEESLTLYSNGQSLIQQEIFYEQDCGDNENVLRIEIPEQTILQSIIAAAYNDQEELIPLHVQTPGKKTIEKTGSQFGRIDILVNSAGITGMTNIKSHETNTVDIRTVFDINFYGILPHF